MFVQNTPNTEGTRGKGKERKKGGGKQRVFSTSANNINNI